MNPNCQKFGLKIFKSI